jgi:DNA-damage-inducible protein D
MTKKTSPPDRIRGFTSLADHEAATAEGAVRISEINSYQVRRIWHDGDWWHSVVDVVGALSESVDGRKYWNKLKQRLNDERSEVVTNCHQLKLPAPDGKLRATDCATTEALFRIIESVPSKNAEPIKQYLAMAGAERIKDTAQPSRLVDRAVSSYRDQGRDDEWIDGRLQNISARNELTDEWKERGAEGVKAAPITQAMHKEMLGHTPAEHRRLKRLGDSHELRDQFDGLELAITTLGERAAKTIIVEQDTKTFADTKAASLEGAKIAGDAARKIEAAIKRPIANKSNFLTDQQRAVAEAEEVQLHIDVEAKATAKLAKKAEGTRKPKK